MCNDEEYLVDFSDIKALKFDVKRLKISLNNEIQNKVKVTQEEEWLKGYPTGNFVESNAKAVIEGNKACFHAISPILVDVRVDYCFYEISPNVLELKIEYKTTFPI